MTRDGTEALASAHAALGARTEAATAADRALALMPPSRDAMIAQNISRQAAAVYAEIGQQDWAVKLLEDLVAGPAIAGYSRQYFAKDPTWETLRNNASFKRIASGE